jgi:hypothetical protein
MTQTYVPNSPPPPQEKKLKSTEYKVLSTANTYDWIIANRHWLAAKNKVDYLHIEQQGSEKSHKTFLRHGNKIGLLYADTIQNVLRPQPQIVKYSRSGIYQVKCLDCPLKYVRQTGRTFKTRYKEQVQDIKSNNSNSEYSNHILNTGHTYGIIADTMWKI